MQLTLSLGPFAGEPVFLVVVLDLTSVGGKPAVGAPPPPVSVF